MDNLTCSKKCFAIRSKLLSVHMNSFKWARCNRGVFRLYLTLIFWITTALGFTGYAFEMNRTDLIGCLFIFKCILPYMFWLNYIRLNSFIYLFLYVCRFTTEFNWDFIHFFFSLVVIWLSGSNACQSRDSDDWKFINKTEKRCSCRRRTLDNASSLTFSAFRIFVYTHTGHVAFLSYCPFIDSKTCAIEV